MERRRMCVTRVCQGFHIGFSIKNKSHFSPEIRSAGRAETSPLTQILLKDFL